MLQNTEHMTREQMAEYLCGYRYGRRMLSMNKYERDYFGDEDDIVDAEDEALIKAKMFEIKRFVTSLPPDDRKLFLYYYYIKGFTVEKCGELLGVSRRTAYRLKVRALDFAAAKYKRYSGRVME